MKQKEIIINAYAQRTIFGTTDYMHGMNVIIKDSKETIPVKKITVKL